MNTERIRHLAEIEIAARMEVENLATMNVYGFDPARRKEVAIDHAIAVARHNRARWNLDSEIAASGFDKQ